MSIYSDPAKMIFRSDFSFDEKSMQLLDYQLRYNPVYRTYYKTLRGDTRPADHPLEIPLIPIRVFKYKTILAAESQDATPLVTFKSSGTTSANRSKHAVLDPDIYHQAIKQEFYRHFPVDQYSIIAYLPGYRDNPDSSLIYMITHLIQNDPLSAIMDTFDASVMQKIERIVSSGKRWVLFGAAFGIMDLIDRGLPRFSLKPEIIETGGMKTHRREISRQELRSFISDSFRIRSDSIHSEYGMCELLSQMYSIGGEWFVSPPWVQVTIRKADNPMLLCEPGEEGKIGITDLANIYSCPFILTDDRGVMREDGAFKVLGRWNPEDLRGCNFLIDRD